MDQMSSRQEIIALVVVVLALIAGFFAYQYYSRTKQSPAPATNVASTDTPTSNTDIGSEILEKAQNPIKDKLPGTVAPIANPLEGAYKNPFE
ncbi:MAG: hypothetical protein AAB938_00250 [Patescibacteria group bacterium]